MYNKCTYWRVDGTLESDAITLNGTAVTATATLSTGISNNNVPKFTSGAADNDFLRIDGTAIEGRSASEELSDIGAQASLTFGISNTKAFATATCNFCIRVIKNNTLIKSC